MAKTSGTGLTKSRECKLLRTGEFGRIDGVAFVRSADWVEKMFREISCWDLSRQYHEIGEQYQGMEIEVGRSPDSIVYES